MASLSLNQSTKNLSNYGMGCFPLGGSFRNTDGFVFAYGEVDDKASIKAIHKAIELGVNLFDTADVYGLGRSEKVLGDALKEYRDDVIIATKFGSKFDEKNVLTGKGTTPKYIRHALEESMKRLQTDFIDIYQFHSSNHSLEESITVRDTLEELSNEGLIGGFGWSTDDPERAALFAESKHCNSIQFALNVTMSNKKMIDLIEKKHIIGLIRSPLASGTLTGKYTKDTKVNSNHMLSQVDFSSERRTKIFEKLLEAQAYISSQGYSLIQGLLLWVKHQSEYLIPMPGAKTIEQVTENFALLNSEQPNPSFFYHLDSLFNEFRDQQNTIR